MQWLEKPQSYPDLLTLPTQTVRCYATARRSYAPKKEHSKATLWASGVLSCVTTGSSKAAIEFTNWVYLDDLTLGGSKETVTADVQLLETEAKNLGLFLNRSKCELACNDIRMTIDDQAFHNFTNMSFEKMTLLGACS